MILRFFLLLFMKVYWKIYAIKNIAFKWFLSNFKLFCLSRLSVLMYIHKNFYDLLIITTFFFIIPQVRMNYQLIFLLSNIFWISMVEWRNIFEFERVLFDKKNATNTTIFLMLNLGLILLPLLVSFIYSEFVKTILIFHHSWHFHIYKIVSFVPGILCPLNSYKPELVSSIHHTKKSSWLKNINLLSVHWWNILAVEKLFLSSISPKKADDWKKQQVTVFTLIKYFISLCTFLPDQKSLTVNCIDSSFSINITFTQEM